MSSHPGSMPRPRGEPSMPHEPEHEGRSGLTAVSLFMVLLVFWVMTQIEYVVIIALFGLLLGTILEGPVGRIQRKLHAPRPAAIFMVYAAIIGLLVLLVFLIIPVITDQADTFRTEIPDQLHQLQDEWRESSNQLLSGTGQQLLGRALEFLDNPDNNVNVSPDTVQTVIPLISGVTGAVVGIVTTLVITFYYLMEKAFIRKLVIGQLDPRRQPRIDRIWQDVEDKVGGWMRGQLILCVIIGTVATIAYAILDIRFWPLLGLWAGITEIIPIVGPWIGGIPAVIVALTQGWEKAVLVGVVILCMQGLENWVLVPRVMRGAVGLSPLTVFIAILAGTQFMGVTGAILAIPIAAAIQVILTDYFAGRQLKRESQQSGWRWMLNRNAFRDEEAGRARPADDLASDHQQRISEDVVPTSTGHPPPPTTSKATVTDAGPRWKPFGSTPPSDQDR
jgi:predicted PurR-regulated permease PerM